VASRFLRKWTPLDASTRTEWTTPASVYFKLIEELPVQSNPHDGETRITAAPLALKDKIIVGASGGDSGVRDWIAGLDAATGRVLWRKFTIPAPGEPGSETWKDAKNAWQTGGAAVWVTGTYDPETN
jgi:alcohol dehydrogenase (cytochrome c)